MTKIFRSLFLIFPLFLLSCSQNLPDVARIDYSVIFDFQDDENLPNARLSVFVESYSDVRRVEKITITSTKNQFCWQINNPDLIENKGTQWCGNANLKMPNKDFFPLGIYKVQYENSDENSDNDKFTLNYDTKIYNQKATEIPDFLRGKNAKNKIIIYDMEKTIIYFGERKKEMKDVRGIWNQFSNAAFYQDVWTLPRNTVICVLPIKEVSLN